MVLQDDPKALSGTVCPEREYCEPILRRQTGQNLQRAHSAKGASKFWHRGQVAFWIASAAVAVAVGYAWKLARRKRQRPPVPVTRGHGEPAHSFPTAYLRHPSRQQRKITSLDEPQYRSEQTEDDRRSARLACREAKEIFLKTKYGAAVEQYTEAIAVCPHWAILYINRAVCYLKLQAWDRAEEDCRSALRREPAHMQAHYLLGTALKALGNLPEAIEHFRQEFEGASRQDDDVKAKIWVARNEARYELWLQESTAHKQKQQQLQTHILHTMRQAQAAERDAMSTSASDERDVEGLETQHDACLTAVRKTFERADAELEKGIPNPLFVCPLTQEIFRDPVCAPLGASFERFAIQNWLTNNDIDPTTREPLRAGQLWANTALRDAAHTYLEDHPWAWVL